MKKFLIFIILLWNRSLFTLHTSIIKPEKKLIHTRVKKDWLGNIVAYEYWFVDEGSDYGVAYYERPIHIMTDVKLIKKEGTIEFPETLFAGTCPYLSAVGYQDAKKEMTICGIGKNLEVIEIPAEARDQICEPSL
jgi:hypothetical protein